MLGNKKRNTLFFRNFLKLLVFNGLDKNLFSGVIKILSCREIQDSLTSGYMTMVIVNMLKKLRMKNASLSIKVTLIGIIIIVINVTMKSDRLH